MTIDTTKGAFVEMATALETTISTITDTNNELLFENHRVGMPDKIPLYKGPAVIIDLLNITSFKPNNRGTYINVNINGLITLVNPGTSDISTINNYELSWLVLKTILETDDWDMTGLSVRVPDTSPVQWGVIPQNRLQIRTPEANRSKLYYSSQFVVNLHVQLSKKE